MNTKSATNRYGTPVPTTHWRMGTTGAIGYPINRAEASRRLGHRPTHAEWVEYGTLIAARINEAAPAGIVVNRVGQVFQAEGGTVSLDEVTLFLRYFEAF